MFDIFAKLLAFFYSGVHSYAGAIALLTLAVMLVLTPLTLKGTRSMMVLQMHQPEMKRLQAQYKDDRQKLNEELLKFYKENNISPLGGCLPLLVQMPVFFVLYRVLHGLTTLKQVEGFPTKVFVPSYLDRSSELYNSLYGKTQMKSFGVDLAESATNAMSHSFGRALPYFLLIICVAATSWFQQRQISGRNPAAASNPQQQMLMKIGPIMITFISLISPGGLVIYFLVSNLFRVGQQALITRTIYSTPEAKLLLERQAKEAADKAKKSAGEPPKGFFQKLLGDAAPQLDKGKAAPKGGGARSTGKPTTNGSNGAGSKAGGSPAASRPASGRTTPTGSRSSAARKKKRK